MSPLLFVHPRDELVSVMHRIYQKKHLTTSGGCNASIRDNNNNNNNNKNGVIWTTPCGNPDVFSLRREDIAYQEYSDDVWHGPYPPEWPFHARIYKEVRSDVRAALHVRSHTLVAYSVTKQLPNPYCLSQAAVVCGGAVGLADCTATATAGIGMPGTEELANAILQQLKHHDCVLVANLGVVIVGKTMTEVYQKFEALEFCARAEIRARVLLGGGGRRLSLTSLTPQDVQAQSDASSSSHAIVAAKQQQQQLRPRPPITTHEMDLRASLVKYVRRSYEQGLVHSSSGAMSARLSERSFLVTPTNVDRLTIQPSDIVLVEESVAHDAATTKSNDDGGNDDILFHGEHKPSRAWAIHYAMYQAFPETNAIMHAHPFHITAFCMCPPSTTTEFTSKIMPESYIVLRGTHRIGFRESLDQQSVVKAFQPKEDEGIPCNVVLVDNDGVIVRGSSVEKVFDRMEVLEATANVILDCKSLIGSGESSGKRMPLVMTEEQTDMIDEKWFNAEKQHPKAKKQKVSSPKYDYGQW